MKGKNENNNSEAIKHKIISCLNICIFYIFNTYAAAVARQAAIFIATCNY